MPADSFLIGIDLENVLRSIRELWPEHTFLQIRPGAGLREVGRRADGDAAAAGIRRSYGAPANHLWSYTGWGNSEVSATFLQPIVSNAANIYTTLTLNTESTYDWQNRQWTVPVNAIVSELVKIGKQRVQFSLGARYYADKPNGGSDWGLRFAITLLVPR